jgi:hypothetical protein
MSAKDQCIIGLIASLWHYWEMVMVTLGGGAQWKEVRSWEVCLLLKGISR